MQASQPIDGRVETDQNLTLRTATVLFLLALVPRLLLGLVYLRAPIGLDDMFQYDMLARSLVSGEGYRWYQRADVEHLQPYLEAAYPIEFVLEEIPVNGYQTTFRAPGYPFFLSGIYSLFGPEIRLPATRIIQILMSAALAPLTAMLGIQLGIKRKSAILAGVLLIFYPILWMYPIGLASENLFIILLLLAISVLLRVPQIQKNWIVIAAGLLLGGATLTRGGLVFFLPAAAVWLWRKTSFRRTLFFTLAVSAVLLPWMVRNSLILERPAFVENSMGYNLFVGFHPEGDGGFVSEVAVIPIQILDDGERDRWATDEAMKFIRADPGRIPELLARRLAYFWGLEDRELTYFYSNNFFGPLPQPWLGIAYFFLIVPLLIVALGAPLGFALTQRRSERQLILILLLASLLAYIPILAEPRFHLPLIPFLAAYAAAAWTENKLFSQVIAGLKDRKVAWYLALLAIMVLIVLWGWDFARDWPQLVQLMGPEGNTSHFNY
jgi:4-amino-4-deoxy-L-arabinose transferase-like glycosyltransferase